MFIPEVASAFQDACFTALTYDPRSIGLSDGSPRNNIEPHNSVSDYSDALTFLASHPLVDSSQVILWGFSFSGTVTLSACSLDPRPVAAIAVCPLVDLTCSHLQPVLVRCAQDRVSQLAGNPPFYIPLMNEEGINPAGFGVGLARDSYELILNARRTIAPTFENKTTIQTYYRLAMWEPFSLWLHLEQIPVLWIVPELDQVSPAKLQLERFEELRTPKRLHIETAKGHMDVLSGESFPKTMKVQTDFIEQVVSGRFST